MSSILGHGLAGMSAWALARSFPAFEPVRHRAWFAAAAAAAVLPDLDSLVGLHHRGKTHTLGFAVVTAGLIAGIAAASYRRREILWLWPAFTLIVWSHPVMDLLTGGGPTVSLFWPAWERTFEPARGGLPLHDFTHNWSDLPSLLLNRRTFRGMFYESIIFGPLSAAAVVQRKWLRFALASAGVVAWGVCLASGVR